MYKHILIVFFSLLAHGIVIGQIENISVRMETGKLLQAEEVPWLKLADFSYEDDVSKYATYDWVVFSPPKFCPFSYHYSYTQTKISTPERIKLQERCSERLKTGALSGLSDEVKKSCECKLILETEKTKGPFNRALWISHDDDLLADESHRSVWLIMNEHERIPVLLSISNNNAGIFKFSGEQLCKFDFSGHIGKKIKISEILYEILKNSDKLIPVICMDQKGFFDIKKISYSIIQRRIIGSSILSFSNGERYEVEPK